MGHIFRNKHEIPVPPFAYVNMSDGRVFTMQRDELNRRRRVSIGLATSKTTMFPNENFKFLYPDLWTAHYGAETLSPHELHIGLYGLFLTIAWQVGLYPMLQKVFGPLNANAILDYAMFSVRHRTDSTSLMEDELAGQLTFSDKLKSDGWYSLFFENQLTDDLIHQFRIDWLKSCKDRDCSRVWLCIDGSNNDCAVCDSGIAESGRAKSSSAVHIYSYMWAVSAADGRPVTWFINNGGKVDAKAFEKIIRFLKASDIGVEGVILDRGFAEESVLKLVRQLYMRYVVMLKSTAKGYKTLFTKYGEDIRWRVAHLISEKCIFGCTERTQLFAKSDEEACVGLFYDGLRGGRKASEDIMRACAALKDARDQIASGKSIGRIFLSSETESFVRLSGPDSTPAAELWAENLQKAVDSRGYSAIASSEDLPAGRISEIYDYRDVSEKQFSALKSQLGADVTRVHDDRRIEAKLAVCFVAAIIRTEIELACRRLGFDTNKLLRELDRSVLTLMPNEEYIAVHDQSARIRRLYEQFGLTDEHLDYFADEVNKRKSPVHGLTRTMPPFEASAFMRKPGRPAQNRPAEDPNKPKRGPGRPKGSRNKKTIEREAREVLNPPQPKRKSGRPKGSKNKKTLEREALAAAPKRGRGRPKGSKNKKTLEREKQEALKASKELAGGK